MIRPRRLASKGHTGEEVTIEDDVCIGSGAIVTSSTTIGKGAVVAAGSVVTRDVSPRTVIGGVPAMRIRRLADGMLRPARDAHFGEDS